MAPPCFMELSESERDEVKSNGVTSCVHPVETEDMCASCGAESEIQDPDSAEVAAFVSLAYQRPEVRVSRALARSVGKEEKLRLLAQRKMVLLIDLDQTLIHTTDRLVSNKIEGVHRFLLPGDDYCLHTRIRPGTETFLENVSQLFELHVVTFGDRAYADKIVSLLDPTKKYFQSRVLSRDESIDQTSKASNLGNLFPAGDEMVCIIDDREDVWEYASNLVAVKPYVFFRGAGDINAPSTVLAECHAMPASEGGFCSAALSPENPEALLADQDIVACLETLIEVTSVEADGVIDFHDSDDHLTHLERTLRKIHRAYFKRYERRRSKKPERSAPMSGLPNSRKVIPRVRRKTLKGVVVVFSGCFPINQSPESVKICSVAAALGAEVQNKITPATTHLVAARPGTAKVFQARELGTVEVVSPQWLWSCAERWQRMPEALFPVADFFPFLGVAQFRAAPLDVDEQRGNHGPPMKKSKRA